MNAWRLFRASLAIEASALLAQPAFVALTALAAVSFLVLVSLFGLTGAYAPVALIDHDHGPMARAFVESLERAHHSFALKTMTVEEADAALRTGRLVGIMTIPEGFSDQIASGHTVPIDLRIDNVNTDMTEDVQRALPTAIVDFGRRQQFPGLTTKMAEHDVIPHDTGFIPYLVASGLALDAMVLAGVLGAMATAREWERKTVTFLRLAPSSRAVVLAGKLSAAAATAFAALLLALVAIVAVYRVVPIAPVTTVLTLFASVVIFTALGACLGALVKRTLVAVPLVFGLAMPFYVCSGSLEPIRFDGDRIWLVAHLSPVYYAVGVLEWAFHGLHVTPEPVYVDLLVLVGLAALAIALTLRLLARGTTR